MQQMERFEAQLLQLRSDVDALQSGSDIVPPPQGGRAEKRRRQVYDAAKPEVTTPSIEPLPEVLPRIVEMSEVPAKIQEMETILQRLLRTVYGPKGTPEKVPKYGLVAECQWSWEHIKRGRANFQVTKSYMQDVMRTIKYWSPFWYGLYADLGNSDELDTIGKAMIEAREQKNKICKAVAAEVAAEVAAVASGSSYSAASMVDDTHAATHAPSPWVEGSDTHAPSPWVEGSSSEQRQ